MPVGSIAFHRGYLPSTCSDLLDEPAQLRCWKEEIFLAWFRVCVTGDIRYACMGSHMGLGASLVSAKHLQPPALSPQPLAGPSVY